MRDLPTNIATHVTTTDAPRCDCIPPRLLLQASLTGSSRPLCAQHERAAITAAETENNSAATTTELAADWRAEFAAALRGQTSDTMALNDDPGLAAQIAGALHAPVVLNGDTTVTP